MKKILIVGMLAVLIASMMTALTACSKKAESPSILDEYKMTGGTKAIVIVPGILASGMYEADSKTPVWDPLATEAIDLLEIMGTYVQEGEEFDPLATQSVQNIVSKEILKVLKLVSDVFMCKPGNLLDMIGSDEEGNPNYNVVGVDWFDEEFDGHIRYGALNSCKQLVEGLQALVGDEYEVVVYNYNWTQDNRKAVEGLTRLMEKHNFTESILVAHSMGGIVSTGYLAASVHNRARIDKFISIGTPFYGSFMANEVFEKPYQWKAMIDDAVNNFEDILTELGLYNLITTKLDNLYDSLIVPTLYNMTSIYQLLPTAELVELQVQSGIDSFVIDGQKLTADELYPWYCTRKWSKTTSGARGNTTTRKALKTLPEYRNSLYATTKEGKVFAADLVDTYYIAGNDVGTVSGLVFDGDTIRTVSTSLGDGTVPLASATRGRAEDDEHVFYVDGVAHIPLGCWWQGELVEILTKILKGNQQ